MAKRVVKDRAIRPEDVIREFNDRGVKWLLADGDQFNALMDLADQNVSGRLDFSRMELLPESLIPASFRRRDADVIALVPYRTSNAGEPIREVPVYIMVAHQTKPDDTIVFRLLRDIVVLWERQIEEEQKKANPPRKKAEIRNLRHVISVVLYTGKKKWTIPLSMAGCMDSATGLEGKVPLFDVLTVNLQDTSDEKLTESGRPFGLLMLLMKRSYASKTEFSEGIGLVIPQMMDLDEVDFERAMTFVYGVVIHKRPASERVGLMAQIEELTRDRSEEMEPMAMTTAQEWKKERREGKKEGEIAGMRRVVRLQLQEHFGALPAQVEQKLAHLSPAELDQIAVRSVRAKSLEEVGL